MNRSTNFLCLPMKCAFKMPTLRQRQRLTSTSSYAKIRNHHGLFDNATHKHQTASINSREKRKETIIFTIFKKLRKNVSTRNRRNTFIFSRLTVQKNKNKKINIKTSNRMKRGEK